MKISQSKNQQVYVHKTTPIPKRTRQFCHSSSNNVSELQDESKSAFQHGGIRKDHGSPAATFDDNCESNSTQAFDRNKHSLCTFHPHDFNFPKVSTPFSNGGHFLENTSSKPSRTQSRSMSSVTATDRTSTPSSSSDVSRKTEGTRKELSSTTSKIPIATRKHFSTLLKSPHSYAIPKNTDSLEAPTTPINKFSPFKTPHRHSPYKRAENGKSMHCANSINSTNGIDAGVLESSLSRRSYIAYQRHILRMSRGEHNGDALDSHIANVYKCRFEPTKCTSPMLDEAKNFLNSAHNDVAPRNYKSPYKKALPLRSPLSRVHNLTSPQSKTNSKSKISLLAANSQVDHTENNITVKLVTPVISPTSPGANENVSSLANVVGDPIGNVNDFFVTIQTEANQSAMPGIREELTLKLLHDMSSSLSLNQTKPLSPVASFTRRKNSRNSSTATIATPAANGGDGVSNLSGHHKLLFDVIQNSLLSFEVALKFIVGLSANFYNCYTDITKAGEDSIMAIEDSMLNSVKLVDVIPNEVVEKFLNFGKLCSNVIDKCERSDALSMASLRNIANYFDAEPFDVSPHAHNTETEPRQLYRSNVMSPAPFKGKTRMGGGSGVGGAIKSAYTSTPNNNRLRISSVRNAAANGSRLASLSKPTVGREQLYTYGSENDLKLAASFKSSKKSNVNDADESVVESKPKKSTLKRHATRNSTSKLDNTTADAPKPNPIAKPTTNNPSKPGYHSNSSRRLSSRRTSLFFQNPPGMSDNAMVNVEVDDSEQPNNITVDIDSTPSVEVNTIGAMSDTLGRKRKAPSSTNTDSAVDGEKTSSESKKSRQPKPSDASTKSDGGSLVNKAAIAAASAVVEVGVENGEVASSVVGGAAKRRSTRTKTVPAKNESNAATSVARKPRKKAVTAKSAKVGRPPKKATTSASRKKSGEAAKKLPKKTPKTATKKKATAASKSRSSDKTSKKTVTKAAASKPKATTVKAAGKAKPRQPKRKP